jgi:hypothetical protein
VTDADGFFPGVRLTVPDGWVVISNGPGQLKVTNGAPGAAWSSPSLLLWTDMVATVTNNRDGVAGKPLDAVGSDQQSIVAWLANLSDVKILDGPDDTTVGTDIAGTQLTVVTSDTADFDWDDCPDNPKCTALLADPVHWGLNVSGVGEPGYGFFGLGGEETARIFVGTMEFPDRDHTLYVTLFAPKASDLPAFATAAQPVIDSLIPPDTYVWN